MRKGDFLKTSLKGVLFSNILNSCAMENNNIDINTAINNEFNKIINSKDNSENLIGIGHNNKLCKINLNNKTWLVTYKEEHNEEDNKVDFKIKERFTPKYIASNEILRYFLNSPQPEIINVSTQEFIKGFCLPFVLSLYDLLNYKNCDKEGNQYRFMILDQLKEEYDRNGTPGRYNLTVKDYENSIEFLRKLTNNQADELIEKEISRRIFFDIPDHTCARNFILVPKENSYDISYIDLDYIFRTGESFIKKELNFFIENYNLDTEKINKWITNILKDKDPINLSKKIEENILKVYKNYNHDLSLEDGFIQGHFDIKNKRYKIYHINKIIKLTIKDSIDYCTKSFESILKCKDLKFKNLDGDFLLNNTVELLKEKIGQFKVFLKNYEKENKDIFNSFHYEYQ